MERPTFLAEQYQLVIESLKDGVYIVDPEDRIQFCNAALARLTGYGVEELLGRPSSALYTADIGPVLLDHQCLAPNGEVVVASPQVELRRQDGQRVPVELSIAQLMDAGQMAGRITVVRDITERLHMEEQVRRLPQMQAAHAEIEAAHQRLTFLAETSTILSSSPDYQMMLDNLARCIVPYLADWCVIDMVGEDGWVYRLALAHQDPQKQGLLQELKSRYPKLPLKAVHTLLGVLHTRRSWLRPELPEAQGRAEARDERHWQILQALGYISEMVVPLVARGRILGTITFVLGQTARRYGPADLALAEDLARRCAVAIDNAQLFQQARETEAALKASLREKEVLLKEIHHRVKNNLQIISSLLSLQAGYSEDPHLQAMLEDSQHRIQSIALIHEHLYQASDLARIDFGSYVHSLAMQFRRSYEHLSSQVTISTAMVEVFLGLDQAVPCGLLINELVTNGLKHAFSTGQAGNIHITLQVDADQVMLVVQDTGVGFPEDLDFRTTDSLGLQLVCALTEQLRGTITLERRQGTIFRLTFPISGIG